MSILMNTEINQIRKRISEVERWCEGRLQNADRRVLWSAELRPPVKIPDNLLVNLSNDNLSSAVDYVVARRSLLLSECVGDATDLNSGGRILVFDPKITLSDGLVENSTAGLFAGDNCPAWDLWIDYIVDRSIKPEDDFGRNKVGLLLAWLPAPLLAICNRGLDVHIEDCIYWLTAESAAAYDMLSGIAAEFCSPPAI